MRPTGRVITERMTMDFLLSEVVVSALLRWRELLRGKKVLEKV